MKNPLNDPEPDESECREGCLLPQGHKFDCAASAQAGIADDCIIIRVPLANLQVIMDGGYGEMIAESPESFDKLARVLRPNA